MIAKLESTLIDPMKLIKLCWPSVTIYREQKEILYSVEENPETVVPAANQLGKDFIGALCVLVFFLRRQSARVVTTSVDQPQLEQVLWGEIANFIATSEYKLPLRVNHLSIRRVDKYGNEDPKGYLIGRTAANQAGLQGHHLARGPGGTPTTMAMYDEASGIHPDMFQATAAWRHTMLIIGNCFPCRNYFYQSSKEGDLRDPLDSSRLLRKVIKIKAEHSPNVRLALREIEQGHKPSFEELIPGVVGYRDLIVRRSTWNEMAQKIGLDAEFYEGADVKMYPDERIQQSEERYLTNNDDTAMSIGVDPAAGGDNTSFAVASETKLLKLKSMKTPNTMEIVYKTIDLIHTYGVKAQNVGIDAGGGGIQIAHQLRAKGYRVRTINFGGSFKLQKRAGVAPVRVRNEAEEKMQAYRNKRAFMYHLLCLRLDENSGYSLFDISTEQFRYTSDFKSCTLREQMDPIPFLIDNKGVIFMLSKARKTQIPGQLNADKEMTLTEIVGHSPDELESVLLALMIQYEKPLTLGGGLGG